MNRDEAVDSLYDHGIEYSRAARLVNEGATLGVTLIASADVNVVELLEAIDELTLDEARSVLFAFASSLALIRRQQRADDHAAFLEALGIRIDDGT